MGKKTTKNYKHRASFFSFYFISFFFLISSYKIRRARNHKSKRNDIDNNYDLNRKFFAHIQHTLKMYSPHKKNKKNRIKLILKLE